MTNEELVQAITAKNWRIIWIHVVSGDVKEEQVKLILESDAPDWLTNVFGQGTDTPSNK